MARGDQLARQWKIIQTLFSSAAGTPVAKLAEEVGANARTVYRDLEALQCAGFPIYTERVDGRAYWFLLDTMKNHIPVPFTLPELMALYFYEDLSKTFKGTVFYDSFASLFQKIKAILPRNSKRFLDALRRTLVVSKKTHQEFDHINPIMEQLNLAARHRKRAEIVYYTMSRRKKSRRTVDPYCIWYFNETFYLMGFCHARKELRIFALDRIKQLRIKDETFSMPAGFDADSLMKQSFGVFKGDPTRILIRFDPEVAGYIGEKKWHETQAILPQDDGAIILSLEVAGTEEVRHWIMTWGAKAEVLEPASLREQVAADARAMVKRYGGCGMRDRDQGSGVGVRG